MIRIVFSTFTNVKYYSFLKYLITFDCHFEHMFQENGKFLLILLEYSYTICLIYFQFCPCIRFRRLNLMNLTVFSHSH